LAPALNIAYAVPPDSPKASAWRDGFTAAIERLPNEFEARWLNIHPEHPGHEDALERLPACDVLLAKSNWGWIVDRHVRRRCRRSFPPKAIMISGVADPPWRWRMRFYDVLFFETPWYERRIRRHPRRLHAFGVDKRVMWPDGNVARDIDWLSVGALKPYKRHELLLEKPGRRLVVGDTTDADPGVVDRLTAGGIEILRFLPYEQLAGYYRRARNVLVGATMEGGGERSVLEARACGARVQVEEDNPKLRALQRAPVWDHDYYARQLAKGLHEVA
jgi:hypothetical protein